MAGTVTTAAGPILSGIDVSHYQGTIDGSGEQNPLSFEKVSAEANGVPIPKQVEADEGRSSLTE